ILSVRYDFSLIKTCQRRNTKLMQIANAAVFKLSCIHVPHFVGESEVRTKTWRMQTWNSILLRISLVSLQLLLLNTSPKTSNVKHESKTPGEHVLNSLQII
ncbi:hypothetical protein ALC53_01331, partial [Atta colombica]